MKYQPAKPDYPHQAKAKQAAAGRKAFAFLMAMRTGKTKVVLDEFGTLELAGQATDLLVVAPAGVYRTWVTAMGDHLSADLGKRVLAHVWGSGAGARERKLLAFFMGVRDRPRALLVNVEALSRPGEARALVREYLGQNPGRTYVAIDESTIIKNKSKRTDFIIKFIKPLAAWRRILSGLVTPRSPMDLFYQFLFLDEDILGFNSWYGFRARIAIMRPQFFGGRTVLIIDKERGDSGFRPEAVKELQGWIAPHSFRVPFRPRLPSTYTIREVAMSKEQAKAYSEIKEFATTHLGGTSHVTATVVIAQIMRMHQVLCGHVRDENGILHAFPENRSTQLLELLEDYDGKAVIWCSYDHDVRKVLGLLNRDKEDDGYGAGAAVGFWGGNLKTREAEEVQFLTNPKCRFMVATPSAGGRGRTWTIANLIVYYSNTDNLEHREQSEQRTMGQDKEEAADFVDLVVPGTVDEKIIGALRKKINMATAINGDNYREWLI